MTIPVRLFGCAVLVLGLTGAVPDSPHANTGSGACGLITREEAAAALGAAVPAGAEKAMDIPMQGHSVKAQYCFYGTEVAIARFELGSGAQSVFGQYRQSLASESDYQSLKDLGDEAFLAKGQLAARKGQSGLIVDVGQARGGGPREVTAEKTLAAHALGRM